MPELVDLLRKEKCVEVVTITIPKEVDYADHMIIVTCRYYRYKKIKAMDITNFFVVA